MTVAIGLRAVVTVVVFALTLVAASSSPLRAQTPRAGKIVIAVQPTATPEQLSTDAKELREFLGKRLNRDVEIVFPMTFAGVVEVAALRPRPGRVHERLAGAAGRQVRQGRGGPRRGARGRHRTGQEGGDLLLLLLGRAEGQRGEQAGAAAGQARGLSEPAVDLRLRRAAGPADRARHCPPQAGKEADPRPSSATSASSAATSRAGRR